MPDNKTARRPFCTCVALAAAVSPRSPQRCAAMCCRRAWWCGACNTCCTTGGANNSCRCLGTWSWEHPAHVLYLGPKTAYGSTSSKRCTAFAPLYSEHLWAGEEPSAFKPERWLQQGTQYAKAAAGGSTGSTGGAAVAAGEGGKPHMRILTRGLMRMLLMSQSSEEGPLTLLEALATFVLQRPCGTPHLARAPRTVWARRLGRLCCAHLWPRCW